jgi:hypothetical protein
MIDRILSPKELRQLQERYQKLQTEIAQLGWGIPLDPTPHRDVIGVQTSLGKQLLDVPVRQGKTQIPTNRQKDDFRFELPPLEQTGNR